MLKVNTIQVKDCMEGLRDLPDSCVQCCVTSPPYYHLRDYGMEGQYGLENTPEAYVTRLVSVFEEIKRVLRPDGTAWLNIGDAYWGSGKAGYNENYKSRHKQFGKLVTEQSVFGVPSYGKHPEIKAKDLIGIPWMLAFALRKQGWYLRQDIIWHKRNSMPESVTDRCTRTHEYIFLLTKRPHYYFDAAAISTLRPLDSIRRDRSAKVTARSKYANLRETGLTRQGLYQHKAAVKDDLLTGVPDRIKANRRSVWSFGAKGIREKHFAAFPLELPMLCIKAGSKPKDVILDPFMGAGTTWGLSLTRSTPLLQQDGCAAGSGCFLTNNIFKAKEDVPENEKYRHGVPLYTAVYHNDRCRQYFVGRVRVLQGVPAINRLPGKDLCTRQR